MKRSSIESMKHNAKLDVRLPDQLKDEFLSRCREEGVSSGAVIRSMIIDYVLAQPRRMPAMAVGLKEMIVKRSKWILGGLGGSVVAGLSASSILMAPVASADDMRVDYQLRFSLDGEMVSFSGAHELGLNDGLIINPANADGEVPVQLVVLPRRCHADALILDPDCEVAYQLHILKVDNHTLTDEGHIEVTETTHIASLNLFGQVGRPLNYSHVVDNDDPPVTIQIVANEI